MSQYEAIEFIYSVRANAASLPEVGLFFSARAGDLKTNGYIIESGYSVTAGTEEHGSLVERLVLADHFAMQHIPAAVDQDWIVGTIGNPKKLLMLSLLGDSLCEHTAWTGITLRPDWIDGQSPLCCGQCGGRIGVFRLGLSLALRQDLFEFDMARRAWDRYWMYSRDLGRRRLGNLFRETGLTAHGERCCEAIRAELGLMSVSVVPGPFA